MSRRQAIIYDHVSNLPQASVLGLMNRLYVASASEYGSPDISCTVTRAGTVTSVRSWSGAHSPLYALAHPTRAVVYLAEARGAVRVIGHSGDSEQVFSTGGEAPCHLAVDVTRNTLYSANYAGGSISVFRLDPGGHITRRLQVQRFPERVHGSLSKPHHIALEGGDGGALLVADLGHDAILRIKLKPDGTLGAITKAADPAIQPRGPRSLSLDRFGHLWCTEEKSATVSRLHIRHSDTTGSSGSSFAEWTHTWPASDATSRSVNYPGDLVHSQNGRYLYAANRGRNTITVFDADLERLGPVREIPCGGAWPASLASDGAFLYVACRESNLVNVFAMDADQGLLDSPVAAIRADRPTALALVDV